MLKERTDLRKVVAPVFVARKGGIFSSSAGNALNDVDVPIVGVCSACAPRKPAFAVNQANAERAARGGLTHTEANP